MTDSFNPLGHKYLPEDLRALEQLAQRARVNFGNRGLGMDSLRLTEAVDIGAWSGQSTLTIAKHISMVHAIDTWKATFEGIRENVPTQKEAFIQFCRNMEQLYLYRVWPHVGRATTFAECWPHQVQLVFIDADLRADLFKETVLAWLPLVASTGYMIGCGYGVARGVTEVVDRMKKIMPGITKNAGRSLWWLQVTDNRREVMIDELRKTSPAEMNLIPA